MAINNLKDAAKLISDLERENAALRDELAAMKKEVPTTAKPSRRQPVNPVDGRDENAE